MAWYCRAATAGWSSHSRAAKLSVSSSHAPCSSATSAASSSVSRSSRISGFFTVIVVHSMAGIGHQRSPEWAPV